MFYVTIAESFGGFQYFNFETNFLKKANPFQKTGERFLVKSTKIESATFPYKTALSETNNKTYNGEHKMDLSQRTEFSR